MQESITNPRPPLSFDAGISEDGEAIIQRQSKRWMRYMALVAKIAISAVALGYLLTRYAPHRVDIARVDWPPFIAAVLLIATQVGLNALRWRILLRHCAGSGQTFWLQFQIYYASIFFSQILPSIGSDVVRALYHRKLGTSLGRVALSILLDRGLAIIALMLFALASLPILAQMNPSSALFGWIASVSGGTVSMAVAGCIFVKIARGRPIWLRLPPSGRALAENIYWLLTSRTAIAYLVPLSVFVHLLSIGALALVALSFHVPMSLAAALAVGPAYLVAQVIPISVGGWGVREAAAVVLFATLALEAPDAMLISIAFGIVVLLAALPGAFAWLLMRNQKSLS